VDEDFDLFPLLSLLSIFSFSLFIFVLVPSSRGFLYLKSNSCFHCCLYLSIDFSRWRYLNRGWGCRVVVELKHAMAGCGKKMTDRSGSMNVTKREQMRISGCLRGQRTYYIQRTGLLPPFYHTYNKEINISWFNTTVARALKENPSYRMTPNSHN
jgi:hypothetical protein